MTDPYTAPGLTPGHLGAPPVEPEGAPPGLPYGVEPPDPQRVRTSVACCLSVLGLFGVALVAAVAVLLLWPEGSPPAPDFTGGGTGQVEVSVAQGASITQIGRTLEGKHVVASSRAFAEAAANSPAGNRIQPGTYTLKEKMSAVAALNVLLDPANANALTIPEGWRSAQVFTAIDGRLGLPAGTAKATAEQHLADLGLPADAAGHLEGFLYPASYPVTGDTTALTLLQQMVKEAGSRLGTDGIDQAARANGVSPYGLLAVASLAQAEADNPDDMAKVARVIYNRLAKKMPLQLDSTINYALGRATLTTTEDDTKLDSPFNTYAHAGLPPTPIGNPGRDALRAAINPAEGDWLYFVTVKPGDTRFTDSPDQHRRNVDEFNAYRAAHASPTASASGSGTGSPPASPTR
ncbi:endolytic transglycosylase MltG [Kitasatospora sp. NPDC049285]|uniref:endolytic transglycosylase MltG n=1 Tax=Kitasatospora sp. NPDC049285 TaxID=3157096 RepID=UPI003432E5CC